MAELNSTTIGNRDSELNATSLLSDVNLQAYFRFESGSDTADSSSNSNTLTHVNTPTNTTGKYGNGMDYESSSSQYSYAADDASLDISTSITIAGWIKPESIGTNHILIKGRQDNGNNTNYGLNIQDTDELRFYYYNSAYQLYVTSGAGVVTGEWQHVAATFTFGTGSTMKIYLNGRLCTGSWTSGTGNVAAVTNAERLQIGTIRSTTAVTEMFDGLLDDIAIFDRVLTQAEILTLADHTREGYWRLENGDLTTDSSGNGNTLTTTSSPSEVSGKFGGAAECASNYFDSNLAMNSFSNFTFSAWVNADANTSTNGYMFLSNDAAGWDNSIQWGICPETSANNTLSKLGFSYQDTDTSTRTLGDDTDDFPLNEWVHAALTYDGSTFRLYKNGVEVDTGSNSSAAFNSNNLIIVAHTTAADRPLDGTIDDICVFSRALTPAEILELYEDKAGGNPMFFNGGLALG